MSQPPQGQPPYGPDGQPPSGDQPTQGGGWGQPPVQPPQQPGQGWGQPSGQPSPPPGQGWGQPTGQPGPPPGQPGPPPGQGWGQPTGQPSPPPGQAWPQPATPSYGEQPTQVGGFSLPGQPPYAGGPGGPGGPAGPGGPGGWPPPGAPGAGAAKKRNLIITAVAALVLIVVVAVVLVVSLGGDDDEGSNTASDGSTSSSSSAPTTSSSSSSSSSSSGGLSTAPTGAAGSADFIASLPVEFTDCSEQALAGDGDVAAAACGAAATQPGPQEAQFYLYPDTTTLDTVFQSDVTEEGLTEFPADDSTDCSTTTGYGAWQYSDGTPGGSVACQLTDDGHVIVAWTDDEFLTEGLVRSTGTTQADVAALYDWWTQHSDFQG